MPLTLKSTFTPTLDDGTNLGAPDKSIVVNTGPKGVRYNKDIATTDGTFDLGGVSIIGYVMVANNAAPVLVTTPSTPAITNVGTPGSTTWAYKIVAVQADGTYSAASAAGSTTTGAATLNGTDYNQLDWTAVPNADHYDIYRTTASGTPSSTGKIGSTTGITFNDTGLTGDASTAPSVAADNLFLYGEDSTHYTLQLEPGEFAAHHWNKTAIHHKANTRQIPVEITILDKHA
jgi:hypothetical protein